MARRAGWIDASSARPRRSSNYFDEAVSAGKLQATPKAGAE